MIALIAALPVETELLRKDLSPCEVLSCGGLNLYRGRLCGTTVELLHAGVGKANAAAAATLLALREPEAMIVLGCGGAFRARGLAIGDLALASCEIFGDEGVITPEGFLDLAAMRLPLLVSPEGPHYNDYPVDPAWRKRAEQALAPFAAAAGIHLASGPFVTVSTGSGTNAVGDELAQRTGGLCENMEGAAVALVCARNHIPFFELRGISNLVEDRDLTRWNLSAGALIAQRALLALLGPDGAERSA
jgi:futalosine hydrolase